MLRCSPWLPSLALALAGCGGNVVVDVETGAAPETFHALLRTTMDPNGLCGANADQNQPGAVFLFVASQPITCAQPELPVLSCASEVLGLPFVWEMCIPIQPEVAPKALDFYSYGAYVNLVSVAPGCAGFQTGFLQQGSIDITAVDAATVAFTLAGTNQERLGGELAADGTYEAPRCP